MCFEPANECEAESSSVPLERTATNPVENVGCDNLSSMISLRSSGQIPSIIMDSIWAVESFKSLGWTTSLSERELAY